MELLDWILVCSVAFILIMGNTVLRSRGRKPSSDSKPQALQLNDSLYELYKPPGTPSMYVIFLHGLQSGDNTDPHLATWKSGDGSCVWPQTWLIEKFPGAHVFSVSYTANVKKKFQGGFDMHNIGENLLSDILQGNIGQAPYCPVILVGHCFGGLVIKELCNQAFETFNLTSSDQKKVKLAKFFANIRGIFYYGTPHHGSPLMNKEVDHLESDLLKYFKILSTQGARLNEKFEQLRGLNPKWRIHGLGESRSTKSGLFQGFVGAPEASSRAGDSFNVMEADHIQICRPMTKMNRNFYGLTELLDSIAEDVKGEEAQALAKSRLRNLEYVPEQIIGMDVPIQKVKTQLVESRTLGFVGMGGCGKTTLAKAIFNDLVMDFEFSSFVQDVKLISGPERDVKEKVWSQMHHFGEEMATKAIQWSNLKEKRLLLVLDDVSDRDLRVLFDIAKDSALGSRFIVTSRDRDLLKGLDALHEVPFLNHANAKDLFVRHAFPRQGAPPSHLESLVDAIVKKCDGLPLTLGVLGKYLYKRDEKEEWVETLDALRKAEAVTSVNERLWEKLKLSFDDLQENEKQIFLDAATFFYSKREITLGEARIAWEAAYAPAPVRLLWRTLVDRSLVYDVQEDELVQMHEQLLSLGRRVAGEQDKKRRIWEYTEARDLLQSTSEQHPEEVFALSFRAAGHPPHIRTARSVLRSLKEIRYLDVYGCDDCLDVYANATVDADKEDEVVPFLTNVVFARFGGRHKFARVLFDSTRLPRLVILDLWDYDSEYLPESVSDLSALKILKLSCCGLKNLPRDIGHLQQLQFVHITDCWNLEKLPDSFGDLSALSRLVLDRCAKLQTLPESFGRLPSLTSLQFNCCWELQTLPESFGLLPALTSLQFNHCLELQTLPESFGLLPALTSLQFDYCTKLQNLPGSFGLLPALTSLQFDLCSMQTLPESFGLLPALTSLRFDYCPKLQTLPESFGLLPALTSLQFDYCPKLQTLPESFGLLPALTSLQFKDCFKLQTLPESFGKLSALRSLQFEKCSKMQTLPESFGQLSALQHLQLDYIDDRGLCALPSSFGQLAKLEDLKISGCYNLDILPDSFAELIALRQLSLESVGLTTVPDSIGSLPSLQVLELGCLPFVKKLPPWLGEAEAGLQITSIKKFQAQDGNFAPAVERNLKYDDQRKLFSELHTLALERVASNGRLCDECGIYSLEWPRYKSSTRSNHLVCPNCFQKSGSNASEYRCVDRPIVHRHVICDGCEMNPLEGPRYKSSTRPDFDLCHDCFQRSGSNASDYICVDRKVQGPDGTTGFLEAITAIELDLFSKEPGEYCSPENLELRIQYFLEWGILKRLAGNLPGALKDLNHALEIGLSHTWSDFDFHDKYEYNKWMWRRRDNPFDFRKEHGYDCWKHRAYVKFLLGDLAGARKDAEEALTIRSEKCDGSELTPGRKWYLGEDSVKVLEYELN